MFKLLKKVTKSYLVFNLGVIVGTVIGSTVGTLITLAVVGLPTPKALDAYLAAVDEPILCFTDEPKEQDTGE